MLKVFMIITALLLATAVTPLVARDIVLTVAVPEFVENNLDDSVFDAFEAENPGVQVMFKASGDTGFYGSAVVGTIDDHLKHVAEYAAVADVLYANRSNLTVEGTRAGYFLDLSPLVAGDATLAPDDFLPAAWQSFQWDRGIWAIPVSVDVILMIYDPAAFDAAGLPYPNAAWTIDDLAAADSALAERDSEGKITRPGFFTFTSNYGWLARSLLGRSLYDPSVVPSQPVLTAPDIQAVLNQWAEYQRDGLLGAFQMQAGFDPNDVPLRIEQSFALLSFGGEEVEPQGALLPGGIAGLVANGFAVSAGTQYPDLAYALLKYMSGNARMAGAFFDNRPARESLVGVEDEDSIALRSLLNDEQQALIDQAFASAIPVSELLYTDYLTTAVERIRNEGIDVQTALQDLETQAVENLQKAADQRGTTNVFVATPVPTPIMSAGEVALNFGYTSFITPLPNQDQWDQVIAEFVASDPGVGQVIFETDFGMSLTEMAEKYDCFALPYNATESSDIDAVLSLDPFLDADLNFDVSDLVGNVLDRLTQDNRVWAYPLTIQPQVLWYDNDKFAESGVPAPQAGWTVDTFTDALQSLKRTPDDPAPFVPSDFGGSYILMLVAAYGGLPLDFRTNPVTINFTSPENVTAIQQVLDLAKNGYIDYNELATLGGFGFGSSSDDRIIYNETLNAFSLASRAEQSESSTDYRLATFPRGSQYTPIAYDIGTAYISATTQNAEACYRWINTIAQRPDLFSAMPARRSQINNPEVTEALGVDASAIYSEIDALMQDPAAVEFPSPFGGNTSSVGNFLIQLWLNRAFDRYVLKDADLALELSEAETFARAYSECIASIPPFDPATYTTQREQIAYFFQYIDCATKIDPSLENFFPDLNG